MQLFLFQVLAFVAARVGGVDWILFCSLLEGETLNPDGWISDLCRP